MAYASGQTVHVHQRKKEMLFGGEDGGVSFGLWTLVTQKLLRCITIVHANVETVPHKCWYWQYFRQYIFRYNTEKINNNYYTNHSVVILFCAKQSSLLKKTWFSMFVVKSIQTICINGEVLEYNTHNQLFAFCVSVCLSVCLCMRACVHACVCVCVCVCVKQYID